MRQHKKKWLFDKGKTSGSRKRWSYGGDFANERNTKQFKDMEDAPKKSGMKTGKAFNNRLSFRPLRRFLRAKVGQPWSAIYSEIKERIPKDVWETHNPVEWYVYDNVEIRPDGIVNMKKLPVQRGKGYWRNYVSKDGITAESSKYGMFYVHPDTDLLCYLIPKHRKDKPTKQEAGKKHAELKRSSKKMKQVWKQHDKNIADKAAIVMKEKKQRKNDIQTGQGDKK